MRIVTNGKLALEKTVVALGMFDGVHIGHQVLLQRAAVLAARSNAPFVVCTFTDHPLGLLAPDNCPPALTSFEQRVRLLEAAGVDVLYAQPFSRELQQILPEEYVGELVRRLHPVHVVCGYNHTFGRGGSGTPAFLSALGNALGFQTQVVPQVRLFGEDVSSSAVRKALQQGRAAHAAKLLGRPYSVVGSIMPGDSGYAFQAEGAAASLLLKPGSYRCLVRMAGNSWPCLCTAAAADLWQLHTAAKLQPGSAELLVLTAA